MIGVYDSLLTELHHAEEMAWNVCAGSYISDVPYALKADCYICWRSVRQAIILAEKLKKDEKDEQ